MPRLEETLIYLYENFKDPFPGIPGSLKLPFIGSTFEITRDTSKTLKSNWEKHGNIFKLRALGANVVGLIGHEANKMVLHDRQDIFLSEKGWTFAIGDLFNGAIMLTDGEEHKRFRRIMQTAFHRKPMIGYLDVIQEVTEEFLDKNLDIKNGKLLTYPSMVKLTMQIAGQLFFGTKFKAKHLKAITDVTMASTSPIRIDMPFSRYADGLRARRFLAKYYGERIEKTKKNPGDDMFSQMCIARSEEGETFTDQEIINQMIFVMMASHDTTTSTLTSMIYESAKHPDWQEKMRQESEAFYSSGPLDYPRLKDFKVIGSVMNECLRLHPALVLMPRYCMEDVSFRGYQIPAGSIVAVSPYLTHLDPDIYPNPEKFDPERFNEERAEHKKETFAFIPFGAGNHICIGKYFAEMEAKIVMSQLVKKFKWTVPENYKIKYAPPLNHPTDGLPIKISAL